MQEKKWRVNPKKITKVRGDKTHYAFARQFSPAKPGHVIKAWERGEAKPSGESLEELCLVTGKSPNYFYS